MGGPQAHGFERSGDAAVAGEHHDIGRGIELLQRGDKLETGGARHLEIDERELGGILAGQRLRFGETGGRADREAALGEGASEPATQHFVVIDDQQ